MRLIRKGRLLTRQPHNSFTLRLHFRVRTSTCRFPIFLFLLVQLLLLFELPLRLSNPPLQTLFLCIKFLSLFRKRLLSLFKLKSFFPHRSPFAKNLLRSGKEVNSSSNMIIYKGKAVAVFLKYSLCRRKRQREKLMTILQIFHTRTLSKAPAGNVRHIITSWIAP
ncbi:hypothetical protein HanIR_Chr05g0216751 [Helianthus annuus]|nr:hypothetical protein HanIR_Chr05g0216751 [Helianthus annuus]